MEEEQKNEVPKETNGNIIATQIAPIMDRFGRMLVDLSPHFAILG